MTDPVRATVELPRELVEQIVDQVLERLRAEQQPARRWLCGAEAAAAYLGWSSQRVYKRLRMLPHSRDGRLLMFDTQQLDRFLAAGYEGPAEFAPPLELPTRAAPGGAPKR